MRISVDHFPEENGQTTSPAAKEFVPIYRYIRKERLIFDSDNAVYFFRRRRMEII